MKRENLKYVAVNVEDLFFTYSMQFGCINPYYQAR